MHIITFMAVHCVQWFRTYPVVEMRAVVTLSHTVTVRFGMVVVVGGGGGRWRLLPAGRAVVLGLGRGHGLVASTLGRGQGLVGGKLGAYAGRPTKSRGYTTSRGLTPEHRLEDRGNNFTTYSTNF